jgi:tripartite-type tricarboxylate transporter receptor subunit TctC
VQHVALAAAGCSNPSQDVAGGSNGSTDGVPSSITLKVPYSAGGGTDTWARFVAPYLQESLPGNPRVTVENVEGGESVTGSNEYFRTAPDDGSQVLVTSGTTYLQALLEEPGVEFDFAQMTPLMLNGTGAVAYVSSSTGIEDAAALADFDGTLTFGGISATGLDLTLLQAMDVLDVEIDATFGFEGRGPARLALERGEVNLDYQTTSAYKSTVEPMVEEGKAVPLFTFGVLEDGEIVRDPAFPDIPTLEEVYEEIHGEQPSEPAYEAYRAFLVPAYAYQKGIWVKDSMQPEVIDAFRETAEVIGQDEDFKSKGEEILGGYPLASGAEGEKDLRESFEVPDEIRQYTVDMLKQNYGVTAGSH